MQTKFWRSLCASRPFSFVLFLALSAIGGAKADAKDELVGKDGASVVLQKVITKQRPKGPIFIAIPVAYVFGSGSAQYPNYCSPSIRADNSSNAVVEELIIGIKFRDGDGRSIGSSITRYDNIKVQLQDTHFFYQLEVDHCRGVEGDATVMRCVYANGEDCTKDVQFSAYGAVPLNQTPR